MKIDKYLDEKRVIHSQNVSDKAVELAKVYDLDVEVCRTAGLLHDIGKNVKSEHSDKVIAHCLEGLKIAKEEFNITDERILNAILYHTTGHVEMDNYAMVIYIADKICIDRDYEDVEYLRQLIGLPLPVVMAEVIDSSKKFHTNLHKWTIDLINDWGIDE